MNTTDNDLGPYHDWVTFINPGGDTWHQMPAFFIGMGDVSGSYAAWINQPIGSRGAGNVGFFMQTPDLRFPQGATRTEQRADFAISSCESPGVKCKRYFVNRDAGDQFSGLSWGWSNYDFERFHTWAEVGDAGSPTDGNIPFFTKAELDMLEAEGHIRQGNLVAAAALINKTRTAAPDPVTGAANGGGLPPVLAVPGSAATGTMPNCVPKTPVNASNAGGGTLVCGDIMEAMKWEKRLETLMTHFAAWYLDARGWGDLAQGVPLFWATPYEDLLARNITTLYGTGSGVGTAPNSAAAVSGYGW
jgi:hypothetical protein